MTAGKRFQKAGLAHAIRPHDAGDLTHFGLEINAMQDLRAAIVQGKSIGSDHHPRPR